MVKVTRHNDELNMRACLHLNGVDDFGGVQCLIDLFNSDVEIDRNTRNAIAAALGRTRGIRLELKKGNEAPWAKRAETEFNYQGIAEDFKRRLAEPGAIEKNVRRDVAKDWSVSVRTVDAALAWRKRSEYRLEKEEWGKL